MLGRWHATARLPLIICCTLQFSMHKASIEVKGTSVHLEFFHKALSFIVVKLLFLGDHAVTGVASAACTRRRSVCKTIVSTNVSSRSCCKLTNSLFCQLFHRASGFLDKLLEAFSPCFLSASGIRRYVESLPNPLHSNASYFTRMRHYRPFISDLCLIDCELDCVLCHELFWLRIHISPVFN